MTHPLELYQLEVKLEISIRKFTPVIIYPNNIPNLDFMNYVTERISSEVQAPSMIRLPSYTGLERNGR